MVFWANNLVSPFLNLKFRFIHCIRKDKNIKKERIQSNANHPLAESMGSIKFEEM